MIEKVLENDIEKTLRMKTIHINDNLELLPDRNELRNKKTGDSKSLEPRLVKILTILLKRQGKVVTRQSLINSIWGNYNSGEELLTHSISMIRKQVGNDLIRTIPKSGYLIEAFYPTKSLIKASKYYWIIGVAVYLLLRLSMGHH